MPNFERNFDDQNTSTSNSSSNSSTGSSTSRRTIRTSSSSTTTAMASEPGVSYQMTPTEAKIAYLVDIYEECLGVPMTSVVIRKIAEYLEDGGLSVDVVRAAIEDTALAPRPTPRYLLAILKRCCIDCIYTLDDWKAEKRSHESKSYFAMRRKYPYGPTD